MRILANYGHRANGDSYNVTFEQTGDVPMERAEETIDTLFRLAREAVSRQVDKDFEFPPKEEVIIPQLKKTTNGKLVLKDPDAPATSKQKGFLGKLAKEKGTFIENLNSLSMSEASQKIEALIGA